MVRLKAELNFLEPNLQVFQFHYGTIKSLVGSSLPSSTSTFQFHYGTIKSMTEEASKAAKANFNSTMVRLKEVISGGGLDVHLFQFHYGTIKSLYGCCECWVSSIISIPLWYD